ncbi:bifunctional 3-deoxy-7-phosphoheptulonate synthase/chorismate mutase [Hazenella sp. IB182353]|uniref:bifunctional 3-deoxy-7-phosphoheptulonate synthase/chorismate mutase n=1 Tax=Polycladospora coralii TaxID=2771432 RepID=UPI0017461001|nr:bifunctional 3-deoxy-7-phosphoheptulonate synthase/chorismate mutase [Polycladospora coralii]MBS7529950.1 bifunctional 3-deoxy-7-phosphoheptulonate synthase/chorismate mutase [Polycladospora coralii]
MISLSSMMGLKDRIDEIDKELLHLVYKRWELVREADQNISPNMGYTSMDSWTRFVNDFSDTDRAKAIKHFMTECGNFKWESNNGVETQQRTMLYSREYQPENTVVKVNGISIGDGSFSFIMGPCAVESEEQVYQVADKLKKKGVRFLRGGAYKPRTSPYDFQGLGLEGLKILAKVARRKGMSVVTEIMCEEQLSAALPFVDVIQVGSRNMHNFPFLKALGRTDKPILLKRGLSATIEEFKLAAEYILLEGNANVILCERGIRTFETATRNTLDISAVPILLQETHLPVIVDVTHSTGRKDLLAAAAKASIAIGAVGVMAEVHPNPSAALSDAKQQMNFNELDLFMKDIHDYMYSKV